MAIKKMANGGDQDLSLKIGITISINQDKNNSSIKTNNFFENLEIFLSDIYNSDGHEVNIISGKLFINIYSDPVVIQVYYGDNISEREKLRIKKSFTDRFLNIFRSIDPNGDA
jgi:hypothetical protein